MLFSFVYTILHKKLPVQVGIFVVTGPSL